MFLTRWQPKSGLKPYSIFNDDMDDLLDAFLKGRKEREFWIPSVDILDDKSKYVVKAELPGLKKENIDVSIDEGVLTISGERRFEDKEKKDRYHRIERYYGSFTRSISLPGDVKGDKVEAAYKDGILTINIPKSKKEKAKKIDIDVH